MDDRTLAHRAALLRNHASEAIYAVFAQPNIDESRILESLQALRNGIDQLIDIIKCQDTEVQSSAE